MCQHNLPCYIVNAHYLHPGRAFASLYVLLFLEKEAVIGGRVNAGGLGKSTPGKDGTPYFQQRPGCVLFTYLIIQSRPILLVTVPCWDTTQH